VGEQKRRYKLTGKRKGIWRTKRELKQFLEIPVFQPAHTQKVARMKGRKEEKYWFNTRKRAELH